MKGLYQGGMMELIMGGMRGTYQGGGYVPLIRVEVDRYLNPLAPLSGRGRRGLIRWGNEGAYQERMRELIKGD